MQSLISRRFVVRMALAIAVCLVALAAWGGAGPTGMAAGVAYAQGGAADAALLAEGEAKQVIQFNPGAALQKRIFADGFVPNSSEFSLDVGGTPYTAQRAENLKNGQVRIYYVVTGQWSNVRSVIRGSEGGNATFVALLQEGEKRQVIQFNPGAALQKRIFADGFVPNSGEFTLATGGVTYTAQRAESLKTGQVRVYYVANADWAHVGYAARGGAGAAAQAPASPASSPPPSGFGYGVQADLGLGDQRSRSLDLTKGMGFNWVKQQVQWYEIEPNKGQFNWSGLDPIVADANARGLNVLFSVAKAPRWARPANSDFSVNGPPANTQDLADFMRAMASRYKGRVRAYEIWNEQNLWYEWGHEKLDAARYVRLLAAGHGAVKAADPSAIVVSGAPTPTGVNDGSTAIDDVVYLRQMYAAGLKRYADVIGAHPSGYNNPPTALFGQWSDPSAPQFKNHRSFFFRSTLAGYRQVMNANGDSGKKLWVTEFGWASVENTGVGPAPNYEYAAQNTEAEQAGWLVQAFQIATQYNVGAMFVWNLNYAPLKGAGNEQAAFGIVRQDWSQRPAYAALRDMPK